ncbi:Ecdysone-induced protein [Chamberlinius hualienensis]
MMKPTVRFGRVPKREKAKILAAMQSVNARSQERALTLELEDESKLVANIVKANIETCDYTKDKIYPLLQRARENPVYSQASTSSCPIHLASQIPNSNHVVENFSQRFAPVINGVIEFARRIPGFSLLAHEDQVTLLKAGVFEVLLVRLACMFDAESNSMVCLNGTIRRREPSTHSGQRFLMDAMFDFSVRLNAMKLEDAELALFCGGVIVAADRPGLRNHELIDKMHSKMMQALQNHMTQIHPENPKMYETLMEMIPDLRTLNALHSDKLAAFTMDPIIDNSSQQNGSTINNNNTSSSAATGGAANGNNLSTNLHTIYESQVGQQHWNIYNNGRNHQNNGGDDSKGSWGSDTDIISSPQPQQQQRILNEIHHAHHHHASVLLHNAGSDTASAWSSSTAENCMKNPELYVSNLRSPDGGSGSSYRLDHLKSPLGSSSSSSTKCVSPMMLQKDHEGGTSSGDDDSAAGSPGNRKFPSYKRKLDSPTDSGIDSGKELGNCGSGASTSSGSHSRSTSICSSPRSSMEEKVKDIISDCEINLKHESIIEDMPVLKRALQAPPLVNTNMLMDEAYKPHKKFRALRKDSDSGSNGVETSVSPPLVIMTQHTTPSLASTHTTLVKSLSQGPLITEQQQKRRDIIHNIIMRTETHHQQQQQQQQLGTYQQQEAASSGAIYSNSTSPNPQQRVSSPYNNNNKSNILCSPAGYFVPVPATTTSLVSGSNSSSNWIQQQYQVNHRPNSPYNSVSSSLNQNFSSNNRNSNSSPDQKNFFYHSNNNNNNGESLLAMTSSSVPMATAISNVKHVNGGKSPTSPMAGQVIGEHYAPPSSNSSVQQQTELRSDSQPLNLSKKMVHLIPRQDPRALTRLKTEIV